MQRPRYVSALSRFSQPDDLIQQLKVPSDIRERLGSMVVIASHIEVRIERAIWRTEGHEPRGSRAPTDALQISSLIKLLREAGENSANASLRELVQAWCALAEPAFSDRNKLIHGLPVSFGGETITFHANLSLEGEIKKRERSNFWVDGHTMKSLLQIFATLLRSLPIIENWPTRQPDPERLTLATKALQEGKSLLGALHDPVGPSHEKY